MDGPNKLECYIKLGWKGLPVSNTSNLLAQIVSFEEKEVL
jgi:hypothetical protein